MADSSAVARRLVAAPQAEIDHVIDTVGRYHLLLGNVGLTDDQLVANRHLRSLGIRTAWLAALVVLLAPFALVGLFGNLVPLCSCWWRPGAQGAGVEGDGAAAGGDGGVPRDLVGHRRVGRRGGLAVAASFRNLTFPLDPLLEAAFDGDRTGFWPSLAVFVAVPIFGFLALLFVERAWTLARDWLVWRVLLDRRGQLAALRTRRADVVAVTLPAPGRATGPRRAAAAPATAAPAPATPAEPAGPDVPALTAYSDCEACGAGPADPAGEHAVEPRLRRGGRRRAGRGRAAAPTAPGPDRDPAPATWPGGWWAWASAASPTTAPAASPAAGCTTPRSWRCRAC